MKFIGKRKTGLIASALALVFFVAIGVGASFAWFDDSSTSSTVSPASLQTNGLKTDALVYSGNARHTNDDATAQAPVGDEGGTYGYDHAQTGNATSYYLMLDRDGNGSVSLTSGDNLQMFTNIYNSDDEACYFKLSLKAGDYFKIYNSDLAGNLAESWYGYDRIQETNATSFAKTFGTWSFEDDASGSHNIKVKSDAATQVYDIYFDEYSGIWIDLHIDETRSKATSALTGYYVVGDSSSSDSGTFSPAWTTMGGYAMYIDEDHTNNKGIYLGLYLRPGDVFKITTKADSGGEWYGFNEVWSGCGAYSFFADDASGSHNIKCLTTGYYNIYLNGDAKPVSIERYSGSYTSGGNSYTAKSRAPGVKKAAAFDNSQLNYVRLQFQLSDSNNSDRADNYGTYYLELKGGIADTPFPGLKMLSIPGSDKSSDYIDASDYAGWTSVQVHRGDNNGNIWKSYEGGPNQSTAVKSVSANSKNFFKVTYGGGGEYIWWRDETPNEERFAAVQEYRVLDDAVDAEPTETGYCWNNDNYTPVMGASPTPPPGYVFDDWYTDSACTDSWSSSNITKDRKLYAHFVSTSSSYNIYGSFSGGSWGDLSGITQTKTGETANTGTVTFQSVTFAVGDKWKIHRDSNDSGCDNTWWGWNAGLSDYADTAHNSAGNDIYITTAGTFDVTLDIDTGTISLTSLTYNFYQYEFTGGSGIGSSSAALDHSTGKVTFSNVSLQAGKYWHIEGLVGTAAWGWNPANAATDNIQAMSGYATYFAKGDATKNGAGTIWNIRTIYAMTCTIEFTPGTNSINVTSITLSDSQFKLRKSAGVGTGEPYTDLSAVPSISGTVLTFSNVTLLTGYNYFLRTPNADYGWSAFYKSSTYPTMTYGGATSISDPSIYFYTSNSNIGVGYGGQYDIQFDLSTLRFTRVNLDSLSSTDFKISLDSGSGASDQAFTSALGYVWTKTNLRLSIGAELYIHNDNTTITHNYRIDASDLDLSYSSSSWSTYFTKTASNHLKALVDCTVSFTFTYDPTDTTADWVITAFAQNTAVITPYANSDLESGMYFVSGTDDFACDGANASRMFYGTAENVNCVYAYSGLVVSSTSTLYQLKEAYSSSVTTLKEHIPLQTLLNFSNDGTSPGQSGGRDVGNFVQFTRTGTFDVLIYHEEISSVMTWTIEVKLTGKTVDTSSEHESKWSLIGRGTAPASALYDGDFTTNRGLPMWCARGVEDPYPCYAGSIGGIGDTTNGKGATITLLEGDQLALNGSNGLLTPTINATYGTVSSNVVTMRRSGNYYVYAASTSGFTIEFASEYDSRSDTDRSIEASESPSQYGAPISYTKMDGARVKRASGNSLSFASGINASLMDATSDGMIKVFVELRHINQTGRSGNLTATLSSVAAPTGTKYTVKTYNNAATPVQSALGNFESLRNATTRINNQNFANGTMFSSIAVANLASSYFSLATIIEIDIPVTALSIKNSSGTTATFNLAFTIGLNYVEA